MVKGIIGNFREFQRMLPKSIDSNSHLERLEAVKHYMSAGGVLSVSPNGSEWPGLVFPTKRHLSQKMGQLQALKQRYNERLGQWKGKNFEARVYHIANNMKKLKEPLYWQHLVKYTTDADYRTDSEKVKLPVHLVSDPKWRPMVKMFVSDTEYRKQLAETVETSIVYEKDRRVAKHASVLQEFRMQESERKVKELQKKLAEINSDIKALNVLLKWAAP